MECVARRFCLLTAPCWSRPRPAFSSSVHPPPEVQGQGAAPVGPACPLHHLEETRRMAGRGFPGVAGARWVPGPPQVLISIVAVSGQYLKATCLFLFIIIHILPSCFPKLQPRLLMRKLGDHWIGCGYSISRLGLKKSSWVLPCGINDYQPRGSFLLRGY